MEGACNKIKELKEEDKGFRCLLHGNVVRECMITSYGYRHIDNFVMCGSTKYITSLSELSLGIMQGLFAELPVILGTGGNFG